MQPDCAVSLRDVTVRHGRHLALDAITGTFTPGGLTAVVGANGAGKSTLLAAMAGLLPLVRGTITCPARTQGRLAYLPQRAALDCAYPMTVRELVTLGAWRNFGAFRAAGPAVRQKLAAAADAVGLTEHLDRRISALSVGELQRALFARLILWDAAVILLDEPFAAVDAESQPVLLGQIAHWHREGRTVIAVLHERDLVRAAFPHTLVLARRCLAWGPTQTALQALAA
jgi:zinc/manganese transport system ATP-binding protein